MTSFIPFFFLTSIWLALGSTSEVRQAHVSYYKVKASMTGPQHFPFSFETQFTVKRGETAVLDIEGRPGQGFGIYSPTQTTVVFRDVTTFCFLDFQDSYETGEYTLATYDGYACAKLGSVCPAFLKCRGHDYDTDPYVKELFPKEAGVVDAKTTCSTAYTSWCHCSSSSFAYCRYTMHAVRLPKTLYTVGTLSQAVCVVDITLEIDGKSVGVRLEPGKTVKSGPLSISVTSPLTAFTGTMRAVWYSATKEIYTCKQISPLLKPQKDTIGELQLHKSQVYRSLDTVKFIDVGCQRSAQILKQPFQSMLKSCTPVPKTVLDFAFGQIVGIPQQEAVTIHVTTH